MEATSFTVSRRMVVNGYIKGGSGDSGGKRLSISMVVEAWLSDKEEENSSPILMTISLKQINAMHSTQMADEAPTTLNHKFMSNLHLKIQSNYESRDII
ncbi:hypothetical protein Tco_0221879 [Tanacetum coccineum]